MLEIYSVLPGSTAARLGLRKGDSLISLNGEEVHDEIDYKFLVADEHVAIRYRGRNGRNRTLVVDKNADDALGLEFAQFPVRRCRNRCIFCFVDQMPPGCRKTLYIRDDDFRASFLHGNYVTLGSLTEADWQRIFKQRLSPLYVSVHTTDPALRSFMMGNVKAPDIMKSLRRLAEGRIRMHAQVVLCPGVNDGRFLDRTIDDLSGLFPSVVSVAVVPVGLTGYRNGLFPLRNFSRREARMVIERITAFGNTFKRRQGTRFVFASDEFYVKAGVAFPPASHYEEFSQIENGVGMVAIFQKASSRAKLPAAFSGKKITAATGVSFSGVLKNTAKELNARGARVNVVTVKNRFFGPTVTVSGLLTGSDFLGALRGRQLGERLLVPASALREDQPVFLDDMTLGQLEERLGVPITPVADYRDLLGVLRSGKGAKS